MNGQFLCNRPITVTYAYKRDSKNEKYGSMAERILASSKPYTRPVWGGNFVMPNNPANFFPSTNIKPPPPPTSRPPKAPA